MNEGLGSQMSGFAPTKIDDIETLSAAEPADKTMRAAEDDPARRRSRTSLFIRCKISIGIEGLNDAYCQDVHLEGGSGLAEGDAMTHCLLGSAKRRLIGNVTEH